MLRILLATCALLAGAGSALPAQPPGCLAIEGSSPRPGCPDVAAAASGTPETTAPRFEDHPAKAYAGPVTIPTFEGATRPYAIFRSRITEHMREGPNFAGRLSIVQVGCAKGCSIVYVGDAATGNVIDFPVSGERAQGLELNFRRDSDLVVAQWKEDGRCVRVSYLWRDEGFEAVQRVDLGDAIHCWQHR